MIAAGRSPAGALRAVAAEAWRFRWEVECEAEVRFARLAGRLEALGAAPQLVALARRASADEQRHAGHCARLASSLGAAFPPGPHPPPASIAPSGLDEEDAVTYELVAACCVAETVSVAVLTRLLGEAGDPALREVLHELAEDEVGHARLGWAHLAVAASRGRAAFLADHLAAMLRGSADGGLFEPAGPEEEDPALVAHGVLPHAEKRELFVRTLGEVVFPGLEGAGIDVAPGRAWLDEELGRRCAAPA